MMWRPIRSGLVARRTLPDPMMVTSASSRGAMMASPPPNEMNHRLARRQGIPGAPTTQDIRIRTTPRFYFNLRVTL